MNTKAKSILKYIIIFVVVVAVILLAVFLIFAKPKPTEAYSHAVSLKNNDNFNSLINANESLIEFCSSLQNEDEFNFENYYKLKATNNIIKSLKQANDFNVKKLAYASNSKLYNSNCKSMKKLLSTMEEQLQSSYNYISTQLNNFLLVSNATAKTTNTYVFALYNLNNKFIPQFLEFVEKSNQIVFSLENDVTLNPLSIKMLSIINCWSNLQQNESEQSSEELYNNSTFLLNFSNKLDNQSKLYYKNLNFYLNLLSDIETIDLNSSLLKIGTAAESSLTNQQDEKLLAKITNAITFLKES